MDFAIYLKDHGPALLVSFAGTALALSVGAWLKAFMTASGKRMATKEDIGEVIKKVARITATTRRIQARIDGALWEEQNRWESKRDFYVEAVVLVERTLSALRDFKRLLSETSEASPGAEADLQSRLDDADQSSSRFFLEVHLTMKKGRLFISSSTIDAWDRMVSEWAKSAAEEPDIRERLKRFNDSPAERAARRMREQGASTDKMIAAMNELEEGLFRIARRDLRLKRRSRRAKAATAV